MTALRIVDLVEVDGEPEPRVSDEKVAERLGFAQPRMIRRLIKRNAVELERYGKLLHHGTVSSATRRTGSGKRGPEGKEYLLTEGQSVLLCGFARTDRAPDAREEIIKVFLAWRHGRAMPKTPVTTEILRTTDDQTPVTKADLKDVTANIVSMLPQMRADFTEPTQREIRYWLLRVRQGKCPISGKQLLDPETGIMLLDPVTNKKLGHYHHIGLRTNNAFENCIPIAVDAHIEAHNSRQKLEEIRTIVGPKFHDDIDAAKELDDAWVRARAESKLLEEERRQKEWDAQKSPGLLAQEKASAELALKEQHDKSRARPIDTTPLFGGDDEIPVKGGRINPRKRKRCSLRRAAQTGEEATAFGA